MFIMKQATEILKFEEDFPLNELSKAFNARKDQTLRVVALNSCGGLPYPRTIKPSSFKKTIRRLIYGSRNAYNRMLVNSN